MSKTTIHILEIRLYDTLGMRNYSRPRFIHLQTSVYGYNSYACYNILDMIKIFIGPVSCRNIRLQMSTFGYNSYARYNILGMINKFL
jgi:hypothetical protein